MGYSVTRREALMLCVAGLGSVFGCTSPREAPRTVAEREVAGMATPRPTPKPNDILHLSPEGVFLHAIPDSRLPETGQLTAGFPLTLLADSRVTQLAVSGDLVPTRPGVLNASARMVRAKTQPEFWGWELLLDSKQGHSNRIFGNISLGVPSANSVDDFFLISADYARGKFVTNPVFKFQIEVNMPQGR